MFSVQGNLTSNTFPVIMKFLLFKNIQLIKVWRNEHLHTHTDGVYINYYKASRRQSAYTTQTLKKRRGRGEDKAKCSERII